MDYHLKAFLLTVAYDSTIFILGFIAFLFVRRYRDDHDITAASPVLFLTEQKESSSSHLNNENLKNNNASSFLLRLIKYPSLGWIKNLFHNNISFFSADIQRYLNFLKCSIILYSVLSLIGLILILPTNLLAVHDEEASFFDKASAANAKLGTTRVAILYGCTWLTIILSYAIIIKFHFQERKSVVETFRPEYFTVLVRNIDHTLTDSNVFKRQFTNLYPGKVVEAILVLNIKPEKSWKNRVLFATRNECTRSTGLGFVSFSSTDAVRTCIRQNSRIAFENQIWIVEPAPPPEDLIWEQMHITTQSRIIRIVSLYLLLLFFSVVILSVLPTTFLAIWKLLLTPPNETHTVIFLHHSLSHYFHFGWETFTSWLPPLLLYAANSLLLPMLVKWQSNLSGHWLQSSVAASILRGNIVFLLINTILIPLTNNTLMTLADVWIAAESNIDVTFWVRQTGKFLLTNSASFALRYILDCTLISSVSQLLQLPRLLLQCKACKQQSYDFDFGYWYAFGISMFTLILLLSVVSPLVLPFGVFFFTMKYFVDKYNFAHRIWQARVNTTKSTYKGESAWILFAIVLMQFSMSGYFFMIGNLWGGFALFVSCFLGLAAAIRMHAPFFEAPTARMKLNEVNFAYLKTAYMRPSKKELFKISTVLPS